jgi:deoxyribonuclease-4
MSDFHIGGHVSASGGIDKAVERAHAIGGNCVQVFSGSPRVWKKPELSSIDEKKVFAKQAELGVSPIITHALYLINLASENPELVQKSVNAIAFDLAFDAKLKGAGVVVHLGSHQGRGWDAVKEQVAGKISEILAQSPKTAHFLIENAAGQDGKLGGDLHEIRWLMDTVKSDQLGWCFDTCHAFASGYSLGSEISTETECKTNRQCSAVAEIERLNLVDSLRCIHVNDSRDPFGSGRDRHANLGDGIIPAADMQYFLTHSLIKDKPMILEVPGIEEEGPDAENINRLKKLVGA